MMTWVWGILAWVVAWVLLGILVGILLGIRRTLDDVHEETGMTRVMVEEIRNRQTALPEFEHHGTVAMGTAVPGTEPKTTTIATGKPGDHKWKRGRIGEDD